MRSKSNYTSVEIVDEALVLANHSDYGLAAGIFTKMLRTQCVLPNTRRHKTCTLNWTPLWRADFMPNGGLKDSDIGKEGPRYDG